MNQCLREVLIARYCAAAMLFMFGGIHIGAQTEFAFEAVGYNRTNSCVTVSARGLLALSFVSPAQQGYRIGVAFSTDDGSTWYKHDSIAHMRASMLGLQRRPMVVSSSADVLVCAYEDSKIGDQMPKVYVTRSTDAGATWSPSTAVVRGDQAGMQDFSSLAVAPNGKLAIAFISNDAVDHKTYVYVSTSSDEGASWSIPVRATPPSWQGRACECCMTSVAFSSSGKLGVAFRANQNNIRDIHLAISDDGGTTFSDPVKIQNAPWTIGGCPATGPHLVFDGNETAHVVWRDYRDAVQMPIVYYARYTQGTPAPPANIDLSSAVAMDAEYPSVAVSPDGSVVTVVHESSTGVRLCAVTEASNVFSQVIDGLTMQNASCYAVYTPSGSTVVAWTTNRNGVFDIALKRTVTSVQEQIGPTQDNDQRLRDHETALVFGLDGRFLYAIGSGGDLTDGLASSARIGIAVIYANGNPNRTAVIYGGQN